jgi:penicillin-binding protein-related factor A (putative recombinase)
MKETEVQKKILKKLREHKIFCWRVNNMGVPDPRIKGGWRKQTGYNMPGMSDILGIFNKKFLAIEVKAPGRIKNVSETQEDFIKKVKKNGGVAFVADSWEVVKKKLKL